MSFIERLANKQRKGAEISPNAAPVPLSLPEAMSGLAGTFREPNRVSQPMGSQITNLPSQQVVGKLPPRFRG